MALFGPPDIPQLEAKRDIQGLIKALSYKDAEIRYTAVEALGPMRDPAAAEAIVALLADENARVRRSAVSALSTRGGLRVVEPLVNALDDPDPDVRAAAGTAVYRRLMIDTDTDARLATATLLARVRDDGSVEALIKGLMDPDEAVRVAVIKSLQAIGGGQAVAPLVGVLAREQARQKSTGRSSLAVERAASQALDALCNESAVESLEAALGHDDTAVREIVVRRLARLGTPRVTELLVGCLDDADPAIRRAAARGLVESSWQPPMDEVGARYWASLREWGHCADCGPAAIPTLLAAFPQADSVGQADITAALAKLSWEPVDADSLAAQFWANQGQWDKCVAVGEPAIEVLDGVLRGASGWRNRVAATAALASMNQPRTAPFSNVDLVRRALEIIDGDGSDDDKRGLLEALLADESQFDPAAQTVDWCKCGYPAARVLADGLHEPMVDLLGFEQGPGNATTYYCPSCDARRTTQPAQAHK